MDDLRATFTVVEAARKLGVGRDVAYRGVKDGTIPAIKIGGRYVVPKAALDRILAGERKSA